MAALAAHRLPFFPSYHPPRLRIFIKVTLSRQPKRRNTCNQPLAQMVVDSAPIRDIAPSNTPRQPAAAKGSAVAACVVTCSISELASDTAVSSSSEEAPSAQLRASVETMSIPQKDSSIFGDATSGQSRLKEAQIGSPLEGADNKLLAAVSTSSPRADTSTSANENFSSQRKDKELLTTIEAQKQAEVSASAAIDTSTTQTGTATIQFPLTTALAPGQTQGQAMSGDPSGQHTAVSPRPSSSGSSSSAVSLPGTPAPPHELRPPHLPPTQAREDGHEDSHIVYDIIYEASGVRIENCPRGYHVAIYASNQVKIFLERPANTLSSFGHISYVPFLFKVMEDDGICALRMPEDTKASGRVVPTEAGVWSGGTDVEQIFTAVDGFSVTFRFAL